MKHNLKFLSFAIGLFTFTIIATRNALNQYLITGSPMGLLLIPVAIALSYISLREIKIEGRNLYRNIKKYLSKSEVVEYRLVGGLTFVHTKIDGVTRITVKKTEQDV